MRASPCQHSTSRVDLIFSCEAIQSRAVLTKLRPRVGPTCSLVLLRAYGLVDISRDVTFLGNASISIQCLASVFIHVRSRKWPYAVLIFVKIQSAFRVSHAQDNEPKRTCRRFRMLRAEGRGWWTAM